MIYRRFIECFLFDYTRLPAAKDDRGLSLTAGEHFDRAMKAQREGNWALYGEEIKKLGEIIRKMQK